MTNLTARSAISAAALAALLLTGCAQAPPDTHDADVKALQDNEVQWNQDWASKDAAKILAHYSDDATLMAPGMASSKGKDTIQKLLTGMLTDPAVTLKFHATRVEVAKSGDIGYTQGTYTMTMTDPNTKKVMDDHGSYVTTYAKQADGSWKAVSDIATSEVPPPAPAPDVKKH